MSIGNFGGFNLVTSESVRPGQVVFAKIEGEEGEEDWRQLGFVKPGSVEVADLTTVDTMPPLATSFSFTVELGQISADVLDLLYGFLFYGLDAPAEDEPPFPDPADEPIGRGELTQ